LGAKPKLPINPPQEYTVSKRTVLKPVSFFNTPEDLDALQAYINQFNGHEKIIAAACAWMAWNLAAKLTSPHESATAEKNHDVTH